MIRVLHLGEKLTIAGGIESFLYNIYRYMDKNQVQFDFLIREESVDNYYERIILNNGGRIYWLKERNKFVELIEKYKVFKRYKNGIIHIHTNCGIRAIDGVVAKLAGVRRIIFHSHTCMGAAPIKYRLLRPLFRINAHYLFACSVSAGEYFFGNKGIKSNKFYVVNNGIDCDKYLFSEEKKNKAYQIMGVDSNKDPIVAFVGRLSKEKNIGFFIEVCKELLNIRKVKIVIIGDGEEYNFMKNRVTELGLEHSVLYLGKRDDIETLMSGIDILIMPSRYEGLGITLVEAQAAGVRCYASDTIPEESNVTGKVNYISINDAASDWAKIINEDFENKKGREGNKEIYMIFEQRGYIIEKVADFLKEKYTSNI